MADKYEVGYGKPPEETKFKSGKSGNPKGRPKGSKNTYNLMNDILNQKLEVIENGKKIKMSKKAAMLTQLINKAVKGDTKAISVLLPHILMADIKEEEKDQVMAALNHDDKAIIERYLSNYQNIEVPDV
jgi:hypothetical protein